MIRLVLALALTLVLATPCPTLGAPAPATPSPSASKGLPPDVDMRLMLFYRKTQPMGVFPILRKNGSPLCPVRLAEYLNFKVDYVQGARIATLTKASGETAVFKVGQKVCVVKTRAGQPRMIQMPIAPMILTPNNKRITDRMWIPLDTVVELAGGKMNVEGRRVRIDL